MAHGPSKNRNVKHERVPINMITIMNLFIVIIPMLISMWAAYQMAVLYIDVSAGGAGPGAGNAAVSQPVPVQSDNIKIGIFPDGIEIAVENPGGKRIWEKKLPAQTVDGKTIYPLEDLNKELIDLHNRYPQKSPDGKFVYDTVGIYPDPQLKYDVLLRTIDLCKFNSFPNIKYLTAQMSFFAEG